jgi:predicted glycosyltransferase
MSILKIIWGTVAPIDCPNSITPLSTSFREVSITLATKGAAATDNGTIVAVVPIVLPTINLDKGKSKTMSIRNGKERKTFMIPSNILYNVGFSQIPPFSVITNSTPIGNPRSREKTVEKNTIYTV